MTDLKRLTADLKNANAAVRAAAAEQLSHLAEEAAPAAVGLVETMADSDDIVREWANAALESLGPPRSDDATRLAALAGDARANVAYWAVTLLGRLGGAGELSADDSTAIVSALVSALRTYSEVTVRERAAWALGQIGKPARSAISALAQAAAESGPRLSRLAQEALENVK